MSILSAAAQAQIEPDPRAQDTAYYRGILHEMIDMGAGLMRRVCRQGTRQDGEGAPDAASDTAPAAEDVAAYERISRAVRRSIMLVQKLDEPMSARVAPAGGHRLAARRRIIRAVEDAIQFDGDPAAEEALHAEFLDRLDGPDLDDDIAGRPVSEIIADICRDLGLNTMPGRHPWVRRTPADIAVLCARAATTGHAADVDLGRGDGGAVRLRSEAGCRGP